MKTQLSVIGTSTPPRGDAQDGARDCVALALAQDDFPLAAATVAETLARSFACSHAGVGLRRGASVRLAALSGVAELRDEMGLVRRVAAAMDEAIDQHVSLRYPPAASDPPRITLMHAELAAAGQGGALLSVPLTRQRRAIGALCLMRDKPWRDEELEHLEQLAGELGPALVLKQQAHESLAAHLLRATRSFAGRLRGPGHTATKLGMLALLLVLLGVTVIPVRDEVSANAQLQGVIQRSVSAPADSFIQDVYVRPGARVKAGQPLLTLADQELRNTQRQQQSELARYRGEQAEAFARQDRAQMVIAQAHADEIAAQLALTEDQLARTRIVAPFDGIVLRGDLQQQAGAPVKRGDVLMVLSPSADYRLVLQVDERDVGRLAVGQRGEVAFPALPGSSFALSVARITPVARVVDGSNTFEVEAQLLTHAEGLRPGLEGVAHVAEGRRPLLFIAGKRVFDWLDFQLWKLFG